MLLDDRIQHTDSVSDRLRLDLPIPADERNHPRYPRPFHWSYHALYCMRPITSSLANIQPAISLKMDLLHPKTLSEHFSVTWYNTHS